MAKIEDIEKLRPELLTKSVAELERQMAELQMAIDRKKAEQEKAELADVVDQANEYIDQIISGLKFLDSYHLLPEEVRAAHTMSSGIFNPGIRYKPVTADRIILRKVQAANPKKTRRKKVEA